MTPRLTKYGRQHETKNRTRGGYSYFSNCPSPAERLRQRRKARAAAQRIARAEAKAAFARIWTCGYQDGKEYAKHNEADTHG